MRVRPLLTAVAAATALGSLAFAALPPGVTAATVTRSGDTVSFSGQVATTDPGVSEIPNFMVTPFSNAGVADAVGIDLDHATVEELEDGSGLRFSWHLGSDIPSTGVPEGVRYNWAFQAGDQTYQLQVKRTNLVNTSTAEAPLDHVDELAEGDWFFQLRGACVTTYAGVEGVYSIAGCYHLGFFDGEVDPAAGVVSMELPYEAQDEIGRLVAGTFKRGTPIVESQSASMSITASAQAVISNQTSSAYLNGWGTYYPGTVVYVALGSASAPATAYELLDTAGDGSFAGSLTGAGTHLWVKSCSGYGVQGLSADPCTARALPIG